jgi:predicted DNA-binding protein (UPF0251 family)/predicted Fe-Mo cluster-binding NifX family protein
VPRPISERRVGRALSHGYFKPAGIPARELEEVILGYDEAEALRLADLDGLYHEAAARKMGVSRQTFGRIIEEARRKVADVIIHGKALRVEGGEITMHEENGMHTRIAVPTRDGIVDEHFGHCEYFTVFELEGGTIATERRVDSPDGCGCKSDIAAILAKDGVSLMIAGNMGEGAVRVLKANGIDVVRGAAGPVKTVVEAYLAGAVKDSGVGCAEHAGHDCQH